MSLGTFDTLALAKEYFTTTYRKIGGNEASQILAKTSALDNIEANTANTASVEVTVGDPTTVGALCRTIVRTLSGGTFATDPNTEDGLVNRGSSSILVAVGVLTQAQMDDFYSKAETKRYPHINATEYQFAIAKGTVTKKALLQTANGDGVYFTTNAECESHSPRITTSAGTEIAKFFNVATIGLHHQTIPNQYRGQTLFVDDVFNVVD